MTATGHLQLTLYIRSDSVCHDSTQRNSIKLREMNKSTVHYHKKPIPFRGLNASSQLERGSPVST